MNTMDLKGLITKKVHSLDPSANVQFREGPDGPGELLVCVFNVKDQQVHPVRKAVIDIDWTLSPDLKLSLTPLVKNVALTRQFYPQYLGSNYEDYEECMMVSRTIGRVSNWTDNRSSDLSDDMSAANEELALAA